MNTAHPASLPPGPRLSGGIRRSTTASITAASSAVKNIQGPGSTTTGGVAVPASQGSPPATARACAKVVPTKKNAAAELSNKRRDGCEQVIRFMATLWHLTSALQIAPAACSTTSTCEASAICCKSRCRSRNRRCQRLAFFNDIVGQSLEWLAADIEVVVWKSGRDQHGLPRFHNPVRLAREMYENLSLQEIRTFKPWMSMPAGAFTGLHLSHDRSDGRPSALKRSPVNARDDEAHAGFGFHRLPPTHLPHRANLEVLYDGP